MATFLSIALFAILMTAITVYGYRRYAKPARIYESMGAPVVSVQPVVVELADGSKGNPMVRIIQQIGEKVPVSPQDVSYTRRTLIAAGYRSEGALSFYFGIKVVLCVALVILAFLFRAYVTDNPVLRIVLVAAAGLLGYFGPNLVVDHLLTKRHETLRLSLPDALDLMVVCVEAGLGLDQAILNVSRELQITHKEICEELSLVTLEMRAGKRRSEALRNLADRTGEPELRKLVAILLQTDRFGTSMAESLRTHSDFMRVRRRQEAEERANKVGVKLVFPIFFCILPSMFVVAAGPGLLQVFKYLFPLMRSFRH